MAKSILIAVGLAAIALGSTGSLIAAAAGSDPLPTQVSEGEWRASRLIGLPIYDKDNKRIGDISDLVLSKDGKVDSVVIGVGGILDVGEKDVALPLDRVELSDKPLATPSQGYGNPADPPTGKGVAAAAPAMTVGAIAPADAQHGTGDSRGAPVQGKIDMTLADLKAAPDFHLDH